MQFDAVFLQLLLLKDGAVPTLCTCRCGTALVVDQSEQNEQADQSGSLGGGLEDRGAVTVCQTEVE